MGFMVKQHKGAAQESLKGAMIWACVIFVGVMLLGYFWTDLLRAI